MKRLRNKFLSCILAVLLLISGMCFEGNTKADASFSHAVDALTAVTIEAAGEHSVSPIICTEQNSVQQSVILTVRQIRRVGERGGMRVNTNLSYVEILPPNLYFSEAAVAEPSEQEIFSNTVILKFIHQKDGKKS